MQQQEINLQYLQQVMAGQKKLSRQQLQQIAAIVVDKYVQIYGHDEEDDEQLSLKEKLILIFVGQDKLIEESSIMYQTELKEQERRAQEAQQQHINHMGEDQIGSISNKDLKIVVRLLELKNEKHKKLEHMMLKYDLLLGKVKELREKQLAMIQEIKKLEEANKNLTNQIVGLRTENNKLKDNLKKAMESLGKFDQEARNTKRMFELLKQMIAQTYSQMQDKFVEATRLLIQKYTGFINGLKDQLKRMHDAHGILMSKEKQKVSELERTIKQLITDLSVAIKYQRRESENDSEWLVHYRIYKGKKQRQQRHQLYRARMQIPQARNSTEQFINSRKGFLQNIQRSRHQQNNQA